MEATIATLAVVGAGPQLGAAIARRFAREGFDVALLARTPAMLQPLVDDLTARGVHAEAFAADVTDASALTTALTTAEQRIGPVDVLEYSPAPRPADLATAPLVEASRLTVESLQPALQMYLYGALIAVQHVLPGMLRRGSGTVIATSGLGPLVPAVADAHTAAAALRQWLLALHASVGDWGVHVAHVSLNAFIGQGRPGSEPDVIAETYWRIHVERTGPDVTYQDLPEDWASLGLADKFTDQITEGN